MAREIRTFLSRMVWFQRLHWHIVSDIGRGIHQHYFLLNTLHGNDQFFLGNTVKSEFYRQRHRLRFANTMAWWRTSYLIRWLLRSSWQFKRGSIFNCIAGNKWRKRRRLLTPAFHFQILDNFFDAFNKSANVLCQQLSQSVNSQLIGKEINVFPYLKRCTLDIICGIISPPSDCLASFFFFFSLNFGVDRSGYGHPIKRTAREFWLPIRSAKVY